MGFSSMTVHIVEELVDLNIPTPGILVYFVPWSSHPFILDLLGPPPYPDSKFDRVLLDGPCSALGQRPILRCNMTQKELQSYPKLQKSLFAQVH